MAMFRPKDPVSCLSTGPPIVVRWFLTAIQARSSDNLYYNLTLNKRSGEVSPVYTMTADTVIESALTIGSGAVFDNDSTYNLTVGGNWINSGTFSHNSAGTVTFNGYTSVGGTSALSFYHISSEDAVMDRYARPYGVGTFSIYDGAI